MILRSRICIVTRLSASVASGTQMYKTHTRVSMMCMGGGYLSYVGALPPWLLTRRPIVEVMVLCSCKLLPHDGTLMAKEQEITRTCLHFM
jgi:hypothetical protein